MKIAECIDKETLDILTEEEKASIDELIDPMPKEGMVHLARFEMAEALYFELGVYSGWRLEEQFDYIRGLDRKECRKYQRQLSYYLKQNKKAWKKAKRGVEHWRRAITCLQYATNRARYAPES